MKARPEPRPSATGRRARAVLPIVLLVSLAGCGGGHTPPPASDADQARQVLREALDAWKSGESPDALASRAAPIHVSDEDWLAGLALSDYELDPDAGQIAGYSLRCPAVLILKDAQGQPQRRSVRYTVATNPIRSVVRQDDL